MTPHPRTAIVQAAVPDLLTRIDTIQTRLDLSNAEMTILLAMIRANLACIVEDQAPVPFDLPGYTESLVAAMNVQEQLNLTDVELLYVVGVHQQELATRMLRDERHPDDPDAHVDQAPRPPIPARACVGDVIGDNARGISPNVLAFTDDDGDSWERAEGDDRYASDDLGGLDRSQEYDWVTAGGGGHTTDQGALYGAPLTVTKVRA